MVTPPTIHRMPPAPGDEQAWTKYRRWLAEERKRKQARARRTARQQKTVLAWSIFIVLTVCCAITVLLIKIFGLWTFLAAVASGVSFWLVGDSFVRWIKKWI